MSDSIQAITYPWRIMLFGEPRAEFHGTPSGRFDYHRSTLLFVRLASAPARVWSRDEIAELLWPGEYVEVGRDRLRQTLAVLNKALREAGGESPIVATRMHLSLNTDVTSVDIDEFSAWIKRAGSAHTPDQRIDALNQALALVQGTVAERLTEDWVQAFREQVSNEVHRARLDLAQAFRDQGRNEEALTALQDAFKERPLSEEAHFLRAAILHSQGKSAEAATLAKEFEKRLQAEFNLQPGPQWRALFETDAHAVTELQAPAKNELAGQALWHSISKPVTRFFGREAEIAWLADAIRDQGYRLVTLTGPGGSGKTRVAVEFASRAATPEITVIGIGLAEVHEAAQVPHILAGVVGLHIDSTANAFRELGRMLTGTHLWLILDNCEHLMPDITGVVQKLLDAIPTVHILCTSRVLLNVLGEREMALQPLPAPPPFACLEELAGYPSVEMLVERIQARRPEYRMTAEEAPVLAELSGKLEGIPLAIELAASRGSVMTTADMLAALESQLDFLSSKYANLPERHRAMRTALEWSFADLDPDLRRLVQLMSVFVTAWTIEAAAFASGDPNAAEAVEELRSRSLIQADASGKGMRFRMLEVVRQFAQEQMSDEEKAEAQRAHMRYFAKTSTALFDAWVNEDRRSAVQSFQEILADHRAACNTALANPDQNEAFIGPLVLWTVAFYEAIGLMREASQRMKAAIDTKVLNAQDELYAMILWGHALTVQGDIGRVKGIVPVLMEASSKPFDLRLRYLLAINLAHMAWVADLKEDSAKVVPLLEQAAKDIDNSRQFAIICTNLGNTLTHLGRDEEAAQKYLQSIELLEHERPDRVLGYACLNLGRLYQRTGQLNQALAMNLKSLLIMTEVEETLGIGASVRAFVTSALSLDSELRASADMAKLVGYEEAVRRRSGGPIVTVEGQAYETSVESLQGSLGDRFESILVQGESLKSEDVLLIAERIAVMFEAN